ncbi:MAG: proton-conducting transporter membrane subunit [bacterium]|nr:proton-conducting transporter membrane subunit [bacterium]
MFIILIISAPLITALLSLLIRSRFLVFEILTILSAAIELASAILIVPRVISNGSYSIGSYFSIDALGAILMLIISVIGLAASLYSIGYIRREVAKQIIGFHRVKQYYIFLNFFILAMFSAVFTTSPIIMWIGIEATTLSTAFLISFYNKPSATEAAWKYLIVNSVGLLLGFLGIMLFQTAAIGTPGISNWHFILANASSLNPFIAKIAFIFILIGYGTKVGLAPMHTWLPDAHSKAPVPISSLLSGVLLNVAFLAILRFKAVTDAAVGQAFSQNLLIFFGIISISLAAFIIFAQKNYKRLLAYSSIEHMGIISLGFGFGGIGVFAGLLHMIYHSLAKSILFLASGSIFLKYSSTKIINAKGVLSVLPISGIIFLIGFLAITGVPPFGTFLTEFYILSAGMIQHPVITIVALLALIVAFVGFLKNTHSMIFGEAPETISKGEANKWVVVPPLCLVAILLVLSFYLPQFVKLLINSAALIY